MIFERWSSHDLWQFLTTCGCIPSESMDLWMSNLTKRSLTLSSFAEESFFLQKFSLLSWVKDSWGLDLEAKTAKKIVQYLSHLCNALQGSFFHEVAAPLFSLIFLLLVRYSCCPRGTPTILMDSALANGRSFLEPIALGSVRHRRNLCQSPCSPPLPKLCHANPIHCASWNLCLLTVDGIQPLRSRQVPDKQPMTTSWRHTWIFPE